MEATCPDEILTGHSGLRKNSYDPVAPSRMMPPANGDGGSFLGAEADSSDYRFDLRPASNIFYSLMFLLFTGCESHPSRQRIFAITSDLEQRSLSERVDIEEAMYKANVDVYWNGPRNMDVQRQI